MAAAEHKVALKLREFFCDLKVGGAGSRLLKTFLVLKLSSCSTALSFFPSIFSLIFVQADAQQLLREFQRYQLLVRRPNISRDLVTERETLLSQLAVQLKQTKAEFQVTTGNVSDKSSSL